MSITCSHWGWINRGAEPFWLLLSVMAKPGSIDIPCVFIIIGYRLYNKQSESSVFCSEWAIKLFQFAWHSVKLNVLRDAMQFGERHTIIISKLSLAYTTGSHFWNTEFWLGQAVLWDLQRKLVKHTISHPSFPYLLSILMHIDTCSIISLVRRWSYMILGGWTNSKMKQELILMAVYW